MKKENKRQRKNDTVQFDSINPSKSEIFSK
jgi:hypothetical protein